MGNGAVHVVGYVLDILVNFCCSLILNRRVVYYIIIQKSGVIDVNVIRFHTCSSVPCG